MRNLTLACLFAIVRAQAEGDENTVTVTTQNDEILIPVATKEEASLAVTEDTIAEVEPENRTTESSESTQDTGVSVDESTENEATVTTEPAVEDETDDFVQDEPVAEDATDAQESEAPVDSTEGTGDATESNAAEEVEGGSDDDQVVDEGDEEGSTATTDDQTTETETDSTEVTDDTTETTDDQVTETTEDQTDGTTDDQATETTDDTAETETDDQATDSTADDDEPIPEDDSITWANLDAVKENVEGEEQIYPFNFYLSEREVEIYEAGEPAWIQDDIKAAILDYLEPLSKIYAPQAAPDFSSCDCGSVKEVTDDYSLAAVEFCVEQQADDLAESLSRFRLIYQDDHEDGLGRIYLPWHGLEESDTQTCREEALVDSISSLSIYYNLDSVYALTFVDAEGNSIQLGSPESRPNLLSFYLDMAWLDGYELYGFRTETTIESNSYQLGYWLRSTDATRDDVVAAMAVQDEWNEDVTVLQSLKAEIVNQYENLPEKLAAEQAVADARTAVVSASLVLQQAKLEANYQKSIPLTETDPETAWGGDEYDVLVSDSDFIETVDRNGQIVGIGLCRDQNLDTGDFSNLYMLWGSYDAAGETVDVTRLQEHGDHSTDCDELILQEGESFSNLLVIIDDDQIYTVAMETDQGRQLLVGNPAPAGDHEFVGHDIVNDNPDLSWFGFEGYLTEHVFVPTSDEPIPTTSISSQEELDELELLLTPEQFALVKAEFDAAQAAAEAGDPEPVESLKLTGLKSLWVNWGNLDARAAADQDVIDKRALLNAAEDARDEAEDAEPRIIEEERTGIYDAQESQALTAAIEENRKIVVADRAAQESADQQKAEQEEQARQEAEQAAQEEREAEQAKQEEKERQEEENRQAAEQAAQDRAQAANRAESDFIDSDDASVSDVLLNTYLLEYDLEAVTLQIQNQKADLADLELNLEQKQSAYEPYSERVEAAKDALSYPYGGLYSLGATESTDADELTSSDYSALASILDPEIDEVASSVPSISINALHTCTYGQDFSFAFSYTISYEGSDETEFIEGAEHGNAVECPDFETCCQSFDLTSESSIVTSTIQFSEEGSLFGITLSLEDGTEISSTVAEGAPSSSQSDSYDSLTQFLGYRSNTDNADASATARLLDDSASVQIQSIGFKAEQFENVYRQMTYWASDAGTPYRQLVEAESMLAAGESELSDSESSQLELQSMLAANELVTPITRVQRLEAAVNTTWTDFPRDENFIRQHLHGVDPIPPPEVIVTVETRYQFKEDQIPEDGVPLKLYYYVDENGEETPYYKPDYSAVDLDPDNEDNQTTLMLISLIGLVILFLIIFLLLCRICAGKGYLCRDQESSRMDSEGPEGTHRRLADQSDLSAVIPQIASDGNNNSTTGFVLQSNTTQPKIMLQDGVEMHGIVPSDAPGSGGNGTGRDYVEQEVSLEKLTEQQKSDSEFIKSDNNINL